MLRKVSILLVLLAACGGKSHSNGGASNAPGMGGATSSGGGNGGSGGTGSGGVSGGKAGTAGAAGADAGSSGAAANAAMSKTEACIAYARAVAMRGDECSGKPPPASYPPATNCPDVLFSDGSTRTVAGLLACIDAWRAFPCDKVKVGMLPDCVTPGTRTPGQSCLFHSQCAGLECVRQGGQTDCGLCVPTAGEGEACAATGPLCKPGLNCSSDKCVPIDPSMMSMAPPPPAPKQTGEPCMAFSDCKVTDYCDDLATPGMRVCTPLPKIGEMCTPAGSYCVNEGYCEPTTNTCNALPTAGQACGLLRGDPYWCEKTLYCDTSGSGTALCRAYPKAGEPCNAVRAHCADASTSCLCTDAACSEKRCLTALDVGAACGATGTGCVSGSQCEGGSCKAIDSQGLFAAACTM